MKAKVLTVVSVVSIIIALTTVVCRDSLACGVGGGDTTPPTPNPAQWDLEPYATGQNGMSNRAVNAQGRVADCCILLGDEAGAQAAYDGMLAAFSNHPRLLESMYFVAEEYTKRGAELENSTDLVGAQQYSRKGLVILEKILNDYPPTSYTPEVCCRAGDAYFRLGDCSKALIRYSKAAENYPEYKNVWHAQLRVGQCYEGLKGSGALSETEADILIKAAFEELIANYPESPSVSYAQNWLENYNSK